AAVLVRAAAVRLLHGQLRARRLPRAHPRDAAAVGVWVCVLSQHAHSPDPGGRLRIWPPGL
ncbi:hypothetical protein MNEG_7805, partial [Monoraphidium neglectum]